MILVRAVQRDAAQAEFLDPFTKKSDVENEQGHADAYKDVIFTRTLEISGATKAPTTFQDRAA